MSLSRETENMRSNCLAGAIQKKGGDKIINLK